MSRRTRYNHRDANEPAIVAALAQLGIEWYEGGPLDGHVWLGQWVPVEIKTAKGKLTAGQKDFISKCNLHERPYRIWRTPLEAIESVQEWRKDQTIVEKLQSIRGAHRRAFGYMVTQTCGVTLDADLTSIPKGTGLEIQAQTQTTHASL